MLNELVKRLGATDGSPNRQPDHKALPNGVDQRTGTPVAGTGSGDQRKGLLFASRESRSVPGVDVALRAARASGARG